jgi:hypothetical protein
MKFTVLLLLVLLASASIGFSTRAPQQPAAAHVWRPSQKTDGLGGTSYTRFTLVGKFVNAPQDDLSNRPALVMDCVPGKASHRPKGRFLTGNLLVGTILKIDYVEPQEIHGTSYYPKVAVRYRLDDGKEEGENWTPGTEKTSAAIPKAALKKMLRAHRVEITADDEHGSPVGMQFEMPDAEPVEEGCNLDEHKE